MSALHKRDDRFSEASRTAVTRAYDGLRLVGHDEVSAFRAAVMVLRIRHPGRTEGEYAKLVASWLEYEDDR